MKKLLFFACVLPFFIYGQNISLNDRIAAINKLNTYLYENNQASQCIDISKKAKYCSFDNHEYSYLDFMIFDNDGYFIHGRYNYEINIFDDGSEFEINTKNIYFISLKIHGMVNGHILKEIYFDKIGNPIQLIRINKIPSHVNEGEKEVILDELNLLKESNKAFRYLSLIF